MPARLRLPLYVGATVLCALAALLGTPLIAPDRTFDRPWLLAAIAAVVALEQLLSVRMIKGQHGESRGHEDALVVFIALLVPPFHAVAAFAAGVIAGQLLAVHRGPVKALFNAAQFTASGALAFIVAEALVPSGKPGLARVIAVLAGVLVFSLVNRAAVSGVLAVVGATAFRRDFLDDLRPVAVVWAGTVSIALLAGLAVTAHPWAAPVALPAMVALSFAFSGHARARRERQALSDIVRSSPAAIVAVDRRGRVRTWNPAMERVTGYTTEETIGRSLTELVRLSHQDGAAADELLSPEIAEPSEGRLVRLEAEGDERWLTLSRAPLPEGGFAFIAQDVTGQRAAEEAVRDSEARLRLALDAGRMGWWEWDIASGEVRWSEELERLFGLEPGAFGGTYEDYISRIHPDDRPAVERAIERGLTEGRHELVARLVHPDGTVRWHEGKGRLLTDAHDRPRGMVGVAFDVNDRKEAEKALRRSQELHRVVVENAGDLITLVDREGSVVYASPSLERSLGISSNDLVGTPILDLVHPDDLADVQAALSATWAGAAGQIYAARIRDANGHWVSVEGVGSPVYGPGGEVEMILASARDVSDRLRAEEDRARLEEELRQAQKMDAVGRLAGGIAHDFNNLMSAVLGFGELALHRLPEGDPVRGYLDEIVRAGVRASDMTNQLLAFSRKQVLQPRVLDVNAVVAGSEKLLGRLIGEDVALVTALEPDLDPVEVDPGQLEQVIVNLVVNARDAMPLGGTVVIATGSVLLDEAAARHLELQPGPYVRLSVGDTGMGMDAATLSRAFEPFFTTKEPGKGTGLGLATVFGIVKQSGGGVSVSSELGQGTALDIYLPRAARSIEPDEPRSSPIDLPVGSETILLVEDEAAVRRLEREVLEACGYSVIEAEGPGSALELGARYQGPIHLLLTDVVMPEMSGPDLGALLSAVRPETRILYASGYTDDAIAARCVLDPAAAFIAKPLAPAALARKVRDVLDR